MFVVFKKNLSLKFASMIFFSASEGASAGSANKPSPSSLPVEEGGLQKMREDLPAVVIVTPSPSSVDAAAVTSGRRYLWRRRGMAREGRHGAGGFEASLVASSPPVLVTGRLR